MKKRTSVFVVALLAVVLLFGIWGCGDGGAGSTPLSNASGANATSFGTPAPEQLVVFPDAGLEAAIRKAIGKPEGDIHPPDLAHLTHLDASESGIWELGGLEYCYRLNSLSLERNQITDISAISNLIGLIRLDLGFNSIIDIGPIASLRNLTELNLANNHIIDIEPISDLSHVTRLYLQNNYISDVSALSNLINLTELNLENNHLKDIAALTTNKGLGRKCTVDLRNNPLSNISVYQHIPLLEQKGAEVKWE
ncbi:MAG: leucine-rich repeat domain-containing protein [Chloroflexi bacterium]|nr:leucine-rich repeat domain-containing protein [Chloroflexota bacterium]